MRPVKNFLLFLVLLLLGISALQKLTGLIPEKPLDGYSIFRDDPSLRFFTWHRWFSTEFQEKLSGNLEDHVGFRNTLIRTGNQVNYSLFGITNAPGWIAGRNGFLYEEDYIHEYTGEFFIGKAAIDEKLRRLKDVKDSLAAHHIPLIIVYESGKASLYPEYIPHRFHPGKRTMTNADYLLTQAEKNGLPILNMYDYFRQVKDTCPYPLFPRYGMHWSSYGTHLAVNALCRYIEMNAGMTMPVFRIGNMHHSDNSLFADDDIGKLFNLIWPLKPTPAAYPMVSFRSMPGGKYKVIIIADSFYLLIAPTYGTRMFGKQDYWYYNNKLYPYQNNNPPTYVDKTDLRGQILSHDMILLMVSEINMHCVFWNFADEAYRAFHPETKDPLVYNIRNTVRNDREWFRAVVKKSKTEKRPLEEVIRGDAEYMFFENYEKAEGKNYWDTIEYITLKIKRDEKWFAAVRKKASDWKVPLDSMLKRDAIYLYEESKKKH